MSDWNKARAQALKILGEGAEVPDASDAVAKASKAFDETGKAFKTSREEAEAKLLEMDNANSAFLNAIQQFRARIEKNEFKLDAKKDAKKIQQAQKVLTGELDMATIKHRQQIVLGLHRWVRATEFQDRVPFVDDRRTVHTLGHQFRLIAR